MCTMRAEFTKQVMRSFGTKYSMAFPEAGWPMEVNMHAKGVDEALVKAVDLVCPGGSGTGGSRRRVRFPTIVIPKVSGR